MVPEAISIVKFINVADRTFEIPVYQRNYTWDTKNCEKLFEDAMRAYEEGKEHYFGNVVYYCIEEKRGIGYSVNALIDGQQRITTVMLLIAAIRDCEKDEKYRNIITRKYLTNEDGDDVRKVRLKQIEADRDSYDAIINSLPIKNQASHVVRNYNKFVQLIKKSGKTTDELFEMIDTLKIVALDLRLRENNSLMENPQIIFESINATGKPLSSADILRNYLLLGIPEKADDGKDQEYYYNNYWLKIEENIEGAGDVADFINRYLVMKISDAVVKNTEYEVFKKRSEELFGADKKEAAKSALEDLLKYSKYYRWMKKPFGAEGLEQEAGKNKLCSRIESIGEAKSEYALPALMKLAEKADNENVAYTLDDFGDTLEVIESWLFRARITNIISTGAVGRISMNLLKIIDGVADDKYCETIKYELSNYPYEDIWPDDETFKEAFVKYDFYHYYKNYVMRKLEYKISNDRVNEKPDSIEHIMPQTLSDSWKKALGEDWGDIHAKYLNTIGNLSPLSQEDNSINSNDLYKNKKDQYKDCSWKMTRDIVDYSQDDVWNEKDIERRANYLADIATSIWISPLKRDRSIEANVRDNKKERDLARVPDDKVFILNRVTSHGKVDAKMMIRQNAKGRFIPIIMEGSKVIGGIENSYSWRRIDHNEEISKVGDDYYTNVDIDVSPNNSPSGVAEFCLLTSSNGWFDWIDEDTGKPLDYFARLEEERDIEDEQ